MFKKKSLLCLLLLLSLLGTMAVGCGNGQDTPKDTPQQAEQSEPNKGADENGDAERKTDWVLAINATFPPFESVSVGADNETVFEGIDIDIANYIAEQLGITLTINDMTFASLVPTMESGRADMILSGISPTEERRPSCDFSEPYFYPQTAIITLKDSGYTTLESLEGKKVGCSLGTTYANQAATIKDAEVVEMDSTPLVIQEILSGRIEAGLFDSLQAVEFINANEGLEMHMIEGDLKYEDSYVVLLPKGSPYVDEINAILAKMEENGKMDEIFAKHLGEDFVKQYREQVAAWKEKQAAAE